MNEKDPYFNDGCAITIFSWAVAFFCVGLASWKLVRTIKGLP